MSEIEIVPPKSPMAYVWSSNSTRAFVATGNTRYSDSFVSSCIHCRASIGRYSMEEHPCCEWCQVACHQED